MVAVDVLELEVAAVAHAAVDLHRPVGRLADQPVGAEVAHRHPVGDVLAGVEPVGGVEDVVADQLAVGVQFDQRELDRLALGQGRAEGHPLPGVADRLGDAVARRAGAAGRLADAVLVDERAGDVEAAVDLAEHRTGRNPHPVKGELGVVGGHVERPQKARRAEAGRVGRHQERGQPLGGAVPARGPGEQQHVIGHVHVGDPALGAGDHPVVTVALRPGRQPGGVAAVVGLGQREGELGLAGDRALQEALALLG